jgi:Protein of unknown function (DUF2971)
MACNFKRRSLVPSVSRQTTMIVYKYLTPDRIDVLEDSRIRFTQPAVFNDPFETFPCFLEYGPQLTERLQNSVKEKYGSQIAEDTLRQNESMVVQALVNLPKRYSKHFVILSLSKICDNILMWSHYADSHRGFVIGFDSSSLFFSPSSGKAKDGLKAVSYENERYVLPKNGFQSADDPNLREANARVFFTKATCWEYEQEYRILAHPNSADKIIPTDTDYDIRLFNFPIESIKEVIFGFRISEPDQRRIFDIVYSKYSNAKIGKAFPDKSKFSLFVKMFAG